MFRRSMSPLRVFRHKQTRGVLLLSLLSSLLLSSSSSLLLVVVVFLFLLQLLWRGCVCWCVQVSSCLLLCSSPVLLLVVVVFLFLLQLLWRGCVCWCVQASSCLLLYSATVLLNSARCDRSIGGSLHAWMDGWMDGWMNRLLMNKTDLIAAAKHDYLKHCEEIFVDTGSVEVRSVVRSLAFVGSQVRATTQPNLLIAQDHRSG